MAIVLDGTSGISTPDLESAGPISGTTGTFSGAVQVSGVATNLYPLVSGTAVSASGTSVDFTSIPSWVKRITVMFSGVSTNGTSNLLIRLGTSGGVETSGYASSATLTSALGANFTESTAGFVCMNDNAGFSRSGRVTVANITSNTWVQDHVLGNSGVATGLVSWGGGSKTLSDTLDRVRITTVNGTDTFDAGTINIMYE